MNFQIVKVYLLYEIILVKAGLVVAFEFGYGFVQPDRFAQIKGIADLVQCFENFVGPGVFFIVTDADVPEHTVVLEFFGP